MNSFSESQRFNQLWLWLVIIVSALSPIIISAYQWSKGATGQSLIAGASVSFIVLVLVGLLIRIFRLKTSIDETGITYQFFPIYTRPVKKSWDEIEKAYIRQYKPLREYGGWGMRYSFRNGNALNISGNMGLQLVFKNGKKLLLGTQQPEQITETLLLLINERKISNDIIAPTDNVA